MKIFSPGYRTSEFVLLFHVVYTPIVVHSVRNDRRDARERNFIRGGRNSGVMS